MLFRSHYEPAAFCAALLNSQPMGFYAPAQLVADARRHGVDVWPVDVMISEWDCKLEGEKAGPSPTARDDKVDAARDDRVNSPRDDKVVCHSEADALSVEEPASSSLRLGLRMVKGLTEAGAKRIVEARDSAPFDSVADIAPDDDVGCAGFVLERHENDATLCIGPLASDDDARDAREPSMRRA